MKFIYTLFAIFTILVFTGCNDEPKEEILPVKEHTTVEQSSYTIEDVSTGVKYILKRDYSSKFKCILLSVIDSSP